MDVLDDSYYVDELSKKYVQMVYKYEKLLNELTNDNNELLPLKHEFMRIIYKRDERLGILRLNYKNINNDDVEIKQKISILSN